MCVHGLKYKCSLPDLTCPTEEFVLSADEMAFIFLIFNTLKFGHFAIICYDSCNFFAAGYKHIMGED